MNTERPSAWLEVQHRQIDDGIKAVLKEGAPLEKLAEALELLRLHIHLEEVVLFPPLEASGLTMPIFVMQREHGIMWPIIDALLGVCNSGNDVVAAQDDARELFKQLQIHNPKEEQIVYSAADRLAPEGAPAGLLAALKAARMPEGWRCAKAPA